MSEPSGQELVFKVALAGLLHDVGKLGMLAGEKPQARKYAHAKVGEAFVQKYVPAQWQAALAPVGWHHGEWEADRLVRPIEEIERQVKLVALADRLSSGERETRDEDTPRAKRLISPFGRIPEAKNLQKPDTDERTWQKKVWFPARPLELERASLFPRGEPTAGDPAALWQGLQATAQTIAGAYGAEEADIACYLESMFYVLRDHAWCVPSAYWHSEPDVSLFSHLHTTAALAACLAHSHFVDRTLSEEDINGFLEGIKGDTWPDRPEIAGLLGGDLSGIQAFIYSLHNPEGAAASLRARSFYLQILTEVIARWILRKLGLPITNALYIGGGGFTLIVPPSARGMVDELRQEINTHLYRAHGTSLYLGLGYVGLVPDDLRLESGGISQKREELARKLDRDKSKKFSALSQDFLAQLFSPKGFGGEASETEAQTVPCGVCGAEGPKDQIEEVDDVRFCPSCRAFRELGRDLAKAEYLHIADCEPRELEGEGLFTWDAFLAALGAKIKLLRSPKGIPPERPARVFALKDGPEFPVGPELAAGRKFLVNLVPTVSEKERKEIQALLKEGEHVPRVGEIKHFGILAKQSQGAPYLGVLRMDMDNLGRIFSQGLGKYATLSRIATLSFLLSVFFEGWTEKIAEGINKAHGKGWARIYTVYSGGDDLFFVGSWDAVVELALGIRRYLREFTGREDLGISGGMELVHEKYPLYLAAKDAEKAEARAKALREGKDSFDFLGIALPWEEFGYPWEEFGYADGADTAAHWAKRLAGLIEEGLVPRALLERLQRFYAWYEAERNKRGENGPWIWHAAYWLSRMIERTRKEDAEARKLLEELKQALSGQDFSRNIARLALAARWAELLTRKGG